MKAQLLDRLGLDAGQVTVPDPAPHALVWGNDIYVRIKADDLTYRWVSSYVVPDTREHASFD